MGTGFDDLLPATEPSRKAVVDDKKTPEQRVPDTSKPLRGMNWTEMLSKKGLESPGYQETVAKIRERNRSIKSK